MTIIVSQRSKKACAETPARISARRRPMPERCRLQSLAMAGGAGKVHRPLPKPTFMSFSHRLLKATRTVHLYLGVFTAPMLLFFAITGGLQTFGLHESGRNSSYKPPAWLATVAQLHKKQTIVVPVRRERPRPVALDGLALSPAATGSPAGDRRAAEAVTKPLTRDQKPVPVKNLWPMKIFFAIVSLGLLVSVLSGLYMAWRYSRKPSLFSAILAAGALTPLLLLLI